MTRLPKTALLIGTAALALVACSGNKGPGALGKKEDIVIRNNGMPGAAKAPPPGADVSASETDAANAALAMPPPAVEQGQPVAAPGDVLDAPVTQTSEPLPDNSPAMQQAVQEVQDSTAPMPSSTTESMATSDPVSAPVPVTDPTPEQAIIPQEPVTNAAPVQTPPPVPVQEGQMPMPANPAPAAVSPAQQPATTTPTSSVYPATDYPAANVPAPATAAAPSYAPATAPVAPPAPVAAAPAPSPNAYTPLPAGSKYPLDPNAPYSPSAVAAATGAAPTTTSPEAAAPAVIPAPAARAGGTPSLVDPVIIRSAQSALKAKAGYAGPVTGEVDAMFLNALTVYQGQNNLPLGGVNATTLRHLGVIE